MNDDKYRRGNFGIHFWFDCLLLTPAANTLKCIIPQEMPYFYSQIRTIAN